MFKYKQCDNCRFSEVDESFDDVLYCRRYPPTIEDTTRLEGEQPDISYYDNIRTYNDRWCGEYQAAQQNVQPTAFGAGGRGHLANLLVSLGKYLVKIGGG